MPTQEQTTDQQLSNAAAMNEVHAAALRAQVQAEAAQARATATDDIGHNALVAANVEAPAPVAETPFRVADAMAVHSGYDGNGRRA